VIYVVKMCESVKRDLEELELKMKQVETELNEHVQELAQINNPNDSIEEFIIYEQICVLEAERNELEVRRDTLSQLLEYQTMCEHDFITDLVDIDPDRSVMIVYCRHCLCSKSSCN